MKFIVAFPVFISEEVYYCETLEHVKLTIERMCISVDEIEKVRVFEVAKEIDVKELRIKIE